jgi:hypothetical protein
MDDILKRFKQNLGSGNIIFLDARAAGWLLDFSIAIEK